MWSRRLPQQGPLIDLAARLGGVQSWEDDDVVVADVLRCPVIESVSLLDAGQLRRFLDRIGCLLPGDERALAEQWTTVRHRAWQVEDTVPGSSLVLADLGDGATVEAVNGSVSRCTQPGELVFAAVVPTPTGWLLPCHPVGLTPGLADAVADLVAAGIDPLEVAATVVRGTQSATM